MKAGSGGSGQFYAFYFYAGWLETRDLGAHWYPITRDTLSNMQTPSLLTDPVNANHLFLGGDQGLYESHDDGNHWLHISAIQGNVQSIIATNTTPRILYCTSDQGFYHWQEGSTQITQVTLLPMGFLLHDWPLIKQARHSMGYQGKICGSPPIAEPPGHIAGILTGEISFR